MRDIQKKVGKKVRKIRKQKNLSQEELAFRSGLHRTYISDIERGGRNVSIKNIEKIARALGIKPSELLEN
jgi:transcriptional regulator with XRE-family HTH domain